jgi:hypothetical protein
MARPDSGQFSGVVGFTVFYNSDAKRVFNEAIGRCPALACVMKMCSFFKKLTPLEAFSLC